MPPTIVEAQSSQVAEVTEFSNVSIQCKFSGTPKPTVSWRRDDGMPIRLIGETELSQPTTTLTRPTLTSSTFTKLQTASASDSLQDVSNSTDNVVNSWQSNLDDSFGGTSVSSSSSSSFGQLLVDEVRSERLALSRVDRSMSGIYVCTATNGIPPQTSKRVPLYVKCKFKN